MSLLNKVIDALVLSRCPLPENKDEPPDYSAVTYTDVVEALEGAGVRDGDVMEEFRKMLIAEIAFGISNTMRGGPANPLNTLRYEGISALVGLYRDVLGALSDLRAHPPPETHGRTQDLEEEPEEATQGPENEEPKTSGASLQDPQADPFSED